MGKLLGWLTILLTPALAVGAASPVDLALAVDVRWGDESMGPESLREEVARQVLRELERARCYSAIVRTGKPGAADADVLYVLELSDLEVRESWDVSIAERTSPDQDPTEVQNAVEALVSFDVALDLSTSPDALPLRSRAYRQHGSYRPQRNEDPQEEVRRLVIDELARQATKFACRQTAKLPREIERARAAAVD